MFNFENQNLEKGSVMIENQKIETVINHIKWTFGISVNDVNYKGKLQGSNLNEKLYQTGSRYYFTDEENIKNRIRSSTDHDFFGSEIIVYNALVYFAHKGYHIVPGPYYKSFYVSNKSMLINIITVKTNELHKWIIASNLTKHAVNTYKDISKDAYLEFFHKGLDMYNIPDYKVKEIMEDWPTLDEYYLIKHSVK
jgi:hypothetical protein